MKELIGHESPESAYLVADYPYGFRLRCSIRYWVETKKGHGQRIMSQTTNPKRGDVWNKAKGSTYSAVKVLYLDESGHVQSDGFTGYSDEAGLDSFIAKYPETCNVERNVKVLQILRARFRADKRVTWSVVPSGQPVQSPEEQSEIMRKLTILELNKIKGEGQ